MADLERKVAEQKLRRVQQKQKDSKIIRGQAQNNLLVKRNHSIVYETDSTTINRKLVMLNAAYGVLTIRRNTSQRSLNESALD